MAKHKVTTVPTKITGLTIGTKYTFQNPSAELVCFYVADTDVAPAATSEDAFVLFPKEICQITDNGSVYIFVWAKGSGGLVTSVPADKITAGGVGGGGSSSGGSLPAGSTVLDTIQWDASSNAWAAVSSTTLIIYALTRANTFVSIREALVFALSLAADTYPLRGAIVSSPRLWSVGKGYSEDTFSEDSTNNRISNVWPTGGTAPYAWVLTPANTDYIDDFSFTYRTSAATHAQVALVVQRDYLRINHVPYDVAKVQVVGDRPVRGHGKWGSLVFNYAEPAPPASTVVKI